MTALFSIHKTVHHHCQGNRDSCHQNSICCRSSPDKDGDGHTHQQPKRAAAESASAEISTDMESGQCHHQRSKDGWHSHSEIRRTPPANPGVHTPVNQRRFVSPEFTIESGNQIVAGFQHLDRSPCKARFVPVPKRCEGCDRQIKTKADQHQSTQITG